jgi:dienelactone hydrolase
MLLDSGEKLGMTQTARMTAFQSGRRQLEGYIARPGEDGPFPGIILIHEIFGLNENMKAGFQATWTFAVLE